MELIVNTLIEWLDLNKTDARIDRILKLDRETGTAVVIDVTSPKGWPQNKRICDLENAIKNNEARVLKTDHLLRLAMKAVPTKYIEARDRAWGGIEPILALRDPFDSSARWGAIKTTGKSEATIYRLLRKYWQGGQTKDALLPRFDNCGAPGRSRSGTTQKTGPRAKSAHSPGKTLTEDDEKKIVRGIVLFHETQDRRSIRVAYQQTLAKFYNDGHHRTGGTDVPILLGPSEIPSLRQFAYRIKKRSGADALRKRVGERKFLLRHRGVTGRHKVSGPGAHYAIDSTPADVYVVSSINRSQTVGRPTIYLLIDYFSKLIVGVHVTLEHASYRSAALAIENAASDKTEFCAQFGMKILPEQWPAQHLPGAIMADRGELKGPIAAPIHDTLAIRLDNTPPYRADMKGLIERTFGYLNDELLHQLPGRVEKDATRGDKKPPEEARITIEELTRAVIKWILMRNQSAIEDFRTPEGAEEIEPTPLGLWSWGVSNANSNLRRFPSENLKAALLPKAEATITRRGIRLKKNFYTCATAVENQWFVTINGQARITCHYDPRNASVIYLRHGNGFKGKDFEACQLIDSDDIAHQKPWAEVDAFYAAQNERKALATASAVQLRASLTAEINKANAIPRLPKAITKKMGKNVQQARQSEIARARISKPISQPSTSNIIPIEAGSTDARLQLLESLDA